MSELATERPPGFAKGSSPDEVESRTLDALRSAVATLQQKAPGDVEAYRVFVLEIAATVRKAAGGGDQAEAATVEKSRRSTRSSRAGLFADLLQHDSHRVRPL